MIAYRTTISILLFAILNINLTTCDDDIDKIWQEWKRDFNKSYGLTSGLNHKNEWIKNYMRINNHNKNNGSTTYILGLNEFSDMSFEDFSRLKLGFKGNSSERALLFKRSQIELNLNETIPRSLDWRQHGAVTPIRDQGSCGSCWAFSSVHALESQVYRLTNRSIILSPQQLVDCDFKNEGCNGGLMMPAFSYIKQFGLMEESMYPYRNKRTSCNYEREKVAVRVSEFYDISTQDEKILMHSVATIGPLAIGILVTPNFMSYKSGVFTDPLCNRSLSFDDLNHAVLLVGYGTNKQGQDYYILRNQWGTSWGDNGYIYVTRDKKLNCGIGLYTCYAKISEHLSFGHSARNNSIKNNQAFLLIICSLFFYFLL